MTPEVALLIRAVLFSLLLVGIERISKRRQVRRARSEWLGPVVRLQSVKINPVQLSSVQAKPVQVNLMQLNPAQANSAQSSVRPQVVRLEPRRETPAHVFIKRAA